MLCYFGWEEKAEHKASARLWRRTLKNISE
jgi:hypothetical protein